MQGLDPASLARLARLDPTNPENVAIQEHLAAGNSVAIFLLSKEMAECHVLSIQHVPY